MRTPIILVLSGLMLSGCMTAAEHRADVVREELEHLAVMELEGHPDYGDLFREHKTEIVRMRNEATKAGQYLAPETALHMVVAKKMISDRKSKGNEEEAQGPDVTARASTASKSNLRSVRPSNPKEGPATHADIAKMSREDRNKLLEESAERGETF